MTIVSAFWTDSVFASEPCAFIPENTSAAITAAAGISFGQGTLGVPFSAGFFSFKSFSIILFLPSFCAASVRYMLFRAFPVIFRTATKNEQTSAADISVYLRQRFLLFYEPLYYLTVTTNFFVIPLHLTVMVALPFLIPFTTPLLVTVATFLLLLMYVTLEAGAALDLMVVVFPFAIVAEDFVSVKVGFLTVSL